MENVKGKNILVVGATGGIGSRCVKLLKDSGANVFITGRHEEKLADVAQKSNIGESLTMVADATSADDVSALRAKYFEAFDTIDILINASGTGIIKPFDSLSEKDFNTSLQANLVAPFLLLKAFLESMKAQKKGLIINIPGVLGKVPMAGAAAYCASKYGLVGMMQSVREELKRTEIRITNLYLGGVDTPFWDTIDLRVQKDKMVQADEAASAIWFLCRQPASAVVSEMVMQPFNHQAI